VFHAFWHKTAFKQLISLAIHCFCAYDTVAYMYLEGRLSMTAEIAILNKNAVALAADSAVTIQKPGARRKSTTPQTNYSRSPSIILSG